ncbi:hypothetical protein A2165_03990 [Candidatus Curtissbacteria bacterium RBG_13_40_7]|uniref:DUF4395 domain-containing protein n=1 Tax=Candidatus Curtissbacteria bacterium RBG_13_40_7 TaxID=1797706 RepID=A0A1F5FVJ8_9BACT|nr:MAG: hypothetical protein A2165_03990 [Candidatus Curtissbacteria bacterium RBG_13_40_7]
MEQQKCYDNYPAWIVVISNFVSLSTYFIGGFIIYQIGFLWLALYILYILILELRLIKGHCVNCYYYGKTCSFGKGRLSSLFFKKGESIKFCQNKMTWKDIVPDFLVSVIPIGVGIITLIIHFNWLILFLMVLLFILGFSGSALVRGQLACKFCKQRELGCPAQKLFEKNNKN